MVGMAPAPTIEPGGERASGPILAFRRVRIVCAVRIG